MDIPSRRCHGSADDAIEPLGAEGQFVGFLEKIIVSRDGVFDWKPLGLRTELAAVFHLPQESGGGSEPHMDMAVLKVRLACFSSDWRPSSTVLHKRQGCLPSKVFLRATSSVSVCAKLTVIVNHATD